MKHTARNVSHFFHLKFNFGHKKWTSQKWCLEVHRTFSQEFRVKKRLSTLKRMSNRQFLTKNYSFLLKSNEKFVEKSYLKTLIYWPDMHWKSNQFQQCKKWMKKSLKKSIFFIYFQILFEKWSQSQVWYFSSFLQKQHVKIGCIIQNLARHVCKNVWSMVET